jgi:hypothetical protein
MDPPFILDAELSVLEAVNAMRAGRAQIALVAAPGRFDAVDGRPVAGRPVDGRAVSVDGRPVAGASASSDRRIGFVALEDLLEQVIGRFDDETDPVPA